MRRLFELLFTWWNGSTFGTLLYTRLRGNQVGVDERGNRYFRAKRGDRRWVVYNGMAEPSLVPAAWHAWLHRRSDALPADEKYQAREWEKPSQPNHTGTDLAYRPKGSILNAEVRPRVTGDYEAWTP